MKIDLHEHSMDCFRNETILMMNIPLKFLMTSLRISFGFDELFDGNLMSGPLLLLIAEKFGRFTPLSPTSIVRPLDLQ